MNPFNANKSFLLPLLLFTFLALGVGIGGLVTRNVSELSPQSGTQTNLSKMQDIIDVLDQKYVDSIQRNVLFEQTISDMLHKLDPHSNYIPASEMALANEQIEGKFGGVGIRFALIRDTLCVTNVVPNSPSERAGVKAGDRIIAIDSKSIASKKVKNEDVMGLLKGQENTSVTVRIYRNKKSIDKKIVRGSIPIESIVCAILLNDKTGYIRLDQFSVNSAVEFRNAAQGLLRKGMKKLIFDLRDNGGGVLGGATQIADEFLKTNLGIVTVKGAHTQSEIYNSTSEGLLENMPVAILINGNSASASEIVAGALQDNDRGVIVGRRSFGKGLVQQDFGLRDGSNLRLTIARYYSPSGRCIQKPFDGNLEKYYSEGFNREENGELFAPDSTLNKKSKKYKTTQKGRTVYGGGGISPDVFVPVDTLGATFYFAKLRYSSAFQYFAFDFVQDKRTKWSNPTVYNSTFEVSDKLIEQFLAYAKKELKIDRNERELAKSYGIICQTLKAEIARQLFVEQGYFTVSTLNDKEVQAAMKALK